MAFDPTTGPDAGQKRGGCRRPANTVEGGGMVQRGPGSPRQGRTRSSRERLPSSRGRPDNVAWMARTRSRWPVAVIGQAIPVRMALWRWPRVTP